MARPIVKQRTRTNYAPTGQRTAPGLDVVAPINVNAAGGEGAEALSKVLGLAAPAVESYTKQVQAKDAALGAHDAAAGVVDEQKMKRRAYEDAYVASKADADFADKKAQLLKWYEENFDHAKGTPQDLDEAIIKFYQENFGHVQDGRVAKVVGPQLDRLRQEMLVRQAEVTRKAVEDEHVSNNFKAIEEAVATGQTFNAETIKDRLGAVLPGGRAQAVRAYAQMIGELAVKRKDEKLIDTLIPAQWADGTPGPYSIPEVASQLNQQKYYAQRAREAAEGQQERDMKAARDAQADAKRGDLMSMAMAGEDVLPLIQQNRHLFSPEDINSIVTFNEKMKTDREQGEQGDPTAIANIEYRFYSGTAGRKEIIDAANNGDLGTGNQLRQNMHQLLNALDDGQQHVQRMKTDTNYRFYADLLNDEVPITKTPMGAVDVSSVGTHRMAMTRFHELSQKIAPAEAYQQVLKEVPKLADSKRITVDLQAPPSAAEVLQSLRAGKFTPEMKQKYTPDLLGKMFDNGVIDEQQLKDLITLYD